MHQDEELTVYLAKKNDDEAIKLLIKRYRNTVFIVMREYALYLKGVELDDFIQEGNIGILKAIKYFDKSKNVKFSSFVRLCVKSEIISFVKRYSGKKHSLLTNAVYNRKFTDRDIGAELLAEDVYSSDIDNPERIFFLKELRIELELFLKKELSLVEKEVFILLFKGYSYKEICYKLDKEPKKIDNTIQRVRQKLRKMGLYKKFEDALKGFV